MLKDPYEPSDTIANKEWKDYLQECHKLDVMPFTKTGLAPGTENDIENLYDATNAEQQEGDDLDTAEMGDGDGDEDNKSQDKGDGTIENADQDEGDGVGDKEDVQESKEMVDNVKDGTSAVEEDIRNSEGIQNSDVVYGQNEANCGEEDKVIKEENHKHDSKDINNSTKNDNQSITEE